jgi:hypothetical protein
LILSKGNDCGFQRCPHRRAPTYPRAMADVAASGKDRWPFSPALVDCLPKCARNVAIERSVEDRP